MTRKRQAADPADDEAGTEKKERVIHTRVPESLEAELRRRAQDLGISVSNLVRNVIGHAFGLVGDVAADSHAIARAARGEPTTHGAAGGAGAAAAAGAGTRGGAAGRPVPAQADPDEVIAWQPIVLAKNAVCARCNDILPRGREAAIAIGGGRDIVCAKCLEELRQ